MNCEPLRDHYELYVLGAAEEPERSEIQAHLARGCEVCMTELRKAREITSILGAQSELASPSAGLRRRILASVGSPDVLESRRASWWTPIWSVAAVMAIAIAFFAAAFFRGRERDLSQQLAA